jgi:16S rRNA (cytosine967-C5)-methyltransferase
MIKTKDLLLFEKAANFVKMYNGDTPLAESMRTHFKVHKNMGVNDRRRFSQIIYSYYRIGRLLSENPLEECLMLSSFLLGTEETMIIKSVCGTFSFIKPETFEKSIEEKVKLLVEKKLIKTDVKIFPYPELLSKGVEEDAYAWSLFRQSLAFIRIRKSFVKNVLDELKQNELVPVVSERDNECLGFEPASKLTLLDSFEKGMFVIQDKNSQRTLDDLPELKPADYWWDCCCGAGGKSLLFKEKYPTNRIVLSDSRKSILENAKVRMQQAGYDRPEIMQIDLEHGGAPENFKNKFDGIIADVPCSGSGTWARTPEQVHFFRPYALKEFVEKQQKIIDRIHPCLKKGGYLLYITCSVFKAENEEMVDRIVQAGYELKSKKLLGGWNHKADTLFAALLRKK